LSAAIVRSQTRWRTWPPADGVAGHHGHDGLGQPADLDLEVEDVEAADAVVVDVPVVTPDLLVAARAERQLALAGEDDDADAGVVARQVERLRHLEHRQRAEGVADLRPADRDLGHPLGHLVADVPPLTLLLPLGHVHGCCHS